jgi:nucleotide-binding universal stress UspA family protein
VNATRNTGLVSGAVVALVAAVASYTHMRTLAAEHGQAWLSWFIPLSVDGLMVVASLVIIVSRRTDGRSVLAWLALAVGVAASLAANVAAAGSDLASRVVSAWPPVAFAVTFELVLRLVRTNDTTLGLDDDEVSTKYVTDSSGRRQDMCLVNEPAPGPVRVEPDRSVPPTDRYDEDPTDEPTGTAERSDDELLAELRALAERHGGTPSVNAVRTGLRVGTGRARRLLDRYTDEQTPALHAVGGAAR